MSKQLLAIIMLITLLAYPINGFAQDGKNQESFIFSSGQGYIEINGKSNKNVKIIVKNPSNEEIVYCPEIVSHQISTRVMLTNGIGKYEVKILENLFDNVYFCVQSYKIINNISNLNGFLLPSIDIQSNNPEIISMASKIINLDLPTFEKAKQLNDWVTQNVNYDYDKWNNIQNKNLTDTYGALPTLRTLKGVCYDFATFYAAMARAVGIQSKVISGYFNNQYHSWNEVYIPEFNKWVSLDCSTGSILKQDTFDKLNLTDYIKTEEK